ncbi:unnamed protein product [Schistocephalus solidus]|uniref:C2H2-type domain-containing protein n=1 Tax=Schistocephalus solidus TaxID=70667 RepID=A0A183SIS6_SCHSO|nr:unnamed protein product [Schistocephalus solidus]
MNTKQKMYKAIVWTTLVATANQFEELGEAHPGPTCLHKSSEDKRSNIGCELDHRRRDQRAACKSQAPRIQTVNFQAFSTCPRCQRTLGAQIGFLGHLWTQCNNNPSTSTFKSTNNRPPSIAGTLYPAVTPSMVTAMDPTKTTSLTLATYATTSDLASTATFITNAPTSKRGHDRNLSSLRSHIHLTHRPHRALANRTETGEPVSGLPTHRKDRPIH